MFGVALDIKLSDFKEIFAARPKAIAVGLLSQLLLLPVFTLLLALVVSPPTSVALGMVLVAACPGGNVSNYMVHMAKANAALSVSMTTIVTVLAVLVTPLSFTFFASFVPDSSGLLRHIKVNSVEMILTIFQIILIPLLIGLYLNHKYPSFTIKIKKIVSTLSLLVFMGFVIGAIASNYENIINYVWKIFLIVFIHNAIGLMLGFYFARLMGLPRYDAKAISIETGIQNTGLGLLLIFQFFEGIGGMALIAAWYGIWHLLTGMFLATIWSRFFTNKL